jgi:isopenicillin-N N-acyltransferase-like protein
MPRIQRNCVLLDLEQRGKPRVLTFTEAGFVGKIGMNSAGLGLCCNLPGHSADKTGHSLPRSMSPNP